MHHLIYDWNVAAGRPDAPPVMLDDETLRDGLQSPSVHTPTIDQKIAILHLIDALGIETADIGLPGAGPQVAADVERLAREMVAGRLRVAANCAARTVTADIRPVVEIAHRTGLPIECCTFIGSSPIRQYAEDWTLDRLVRLTDEAVRFAVGEGLQVMYVTRLAGIVAPAATNPYDLQSRAQAFSELRKVRRLAAGNSGGDAGTRAHREYLVYLIDKALETN